jgi:hypothetical protein
MALDIKELNPNHDMMWLMSGLECFSEPRINQVCFQARINGIVRSFTVEHICTLAHQFIDHQRKELLEALGNLSRTESELADIRDKLQKAETRAINYQIERDELKDRCETVVKLLQPLDEFGTN